MIINNYNKNEKDQETIKSFDKLDRKSLQDNATDEIEGEALCKVFIKYLDEMKNLSF